MVSLTVYAAYFKNCSTDFHKNFFDPTEKQQDRFGGCLLGIRCPEPNKSQCK